MSRLVEVLVRELVDLVFEKLGMALEGRVNEFDSRFEQRIGRGDVTRLILALEEIASLTDAGKPVRWRGRESVRIAKEALRKIGR